MDYCIGGEDGTAAIWQRLPDLDLDGDGMRDDALADFDGDGMADHGIFDFDNDGTPKPSLPTTARGRGRSALSAAGNFVGSVSMVSSTPVAPWLTSTGSGKPTIS